MKCQLCKKQWGICNPEDVSPSFKRRCYEIVQEAKQAEITISWAILHYGFVWFIFFFSPNPVQFKSCKYLMLCEYAGAVHKSLLGRMLYVAGWFCVTPPGQARRPILPWEKVTVKMGFSPRVTPCHVMFQGVLVKSSQASSCSCFVTRKWFCETNLDFLTMALCRYKGEHTCSH